MVKTLKIFIFSYKKIFQPKNLLRNIIIGLILFKKNNINNYWQNIKENVEFSSTLKINVNISVYGYIIRE